jgi:predicted ATPase/transcriptional regulator with XRE-family HTH domain
MSEERRLLKEPPMGDIISLGAWIKRRRKALDLTQAELAARVSCSLELIQKIEADARRPSREIAARLADRLELADDERAPFIQVARAELRVDRLAPPAQSVVRGAFVPAQVQPSTTDTLWQRPPTSLINLPTPPTPLIGRAQERAQIGALLCTPAVRLVTLTGTGGIGKTRLGLQVAAELIDIFPDGVYFVDLALIREPALVSSAIAQTLGLRETGSQPLLTQLKQFLRDKHMLLLLDNFEHLLDAAAHIAELLAATAQLKLLVTSREHLRLRGEKEVVVPPLALPPPDDRPSTTDHRHADVVRGQWSVVAHYAAVQLFIQRASDARSDFQLTNANATAVAEICARLEGMPLAIELAAARSKLFAPEALLAHLSSPLALLTGGARDLPARQQTIRHTIDWSYHLLAEAEQTLFRRLGVFVGGSTLAAIKLVCAPVEDQYLDHLEEVAALVNKSLLRQIEGPSGEARFVMLETIREYALERLDASGEAERLRLQHARYYLTLGEVVFPDPGPWRAAQTAHLDSDYDNLWSALAWSQTSAGDPELALRLTAALRILWFRRGILGEAIAALKRALNHPRGVGRTVAQAQARFELGQFLQWTGDYAAARLQLEQAGQLAREVGDPWWYAVAVEHMGILAGEQGDSATAWAWLSESLVLFRTLGYASSIAETLNMLAEVAILDEDPARAEALVTEIRASEQQENLDPNLIGTTLNRLGHAAQLRGAYDQAAQFHRESLEYFQAFGDQHFGLPWAYHGLGETALGQGRLDEAGRYLAQGLVLSQTLSDQASSAWCLAGLGSVAALDEAPERAARLWGAAERLRQSIGCRPAPAARATYERALGLARTQLDEESFVAAWARGQAMPLEQAIIEALDDAAEAPISDWRRADAGN